MNKTMKLLGAGIVGVALATGAAFAGDGMHPRRKAVIEKFDTNKDGTLDEAERAQFRQLREAKMKERIAKYDANGDGKLDDSERAIAREAKVKARFEKLDANNDGMLSIDEFKAGAAKRMHGRKGHHRGH